MRYSTSPGMKRMPCSAFFSVTTPDTGDGKVIVRWVWPDIISSDVHGLFPVMHDDSALDYSLAGALARLVALGMPFHAALAAVTVNPARVLGESDEIGTLAIGSRADVTVLEAPSYVHLAYRPGVPLIAQVWRSGVRVV